jgi:VWFA-related protein
VRHPSLILILLAWTSFAQEPVIRLDVQQVLVPVVVTDKKGHQITGLSAKDFQIFEDGVQQDIASFSSDATGPVDDLAALSKSASAGPRHTFVICIDTLHASPANAARTRDALENLFEKEKSTDAQYVLIGIGRQLRVLQAATTNPLAILVKLRSSAFLSAMGGLDASALFAQLQNIRTRMDEFCRRCACAARSGKQTCDAEIDTLKQSVDAEADRWTAPINGLLEQFKNVVGELAKLPTGRTLILISDGFSIDPKRDFYRVISAYLPNQPQFKLDDAAQVDAGLRDALKIASERNIVIDTVDSRSVAASLASTGSMDASAAPNRSDYSMLGTNRPARSAGGAAPAATLASKQNPFNSEASAAMEQLARATGGVYFHEGGDLSKQFRSAVTDGRQYYVIAYTPKNAARDGKFRSITVETTGRNLNIRAKSGYWAAQ